MGPRKRRLSSASWMTGRQVSFAAAAVLLMIVLVGSIPLPGSSRDGDQVRGLASILDAESEQYEIAYNPVTSDLFLRFTPDITSQLAGLLEEQGDPEEGGLRVSPKSRLYPYLAPFDEDSSLSQRLLYHEATVEAGLTSPTPGRLYEIQMSIPSTVEVESVLRGGIPVSFRAGITASGEPLDLVYAYDRPPVVSSDDVITYAAPSQGGYQDYFVLGDDWDDPSQPGNDDLNRIMFVDWTEAAYGGGGGGIIVPSWAHTSSNVSIAAYGKVKVYLDEVENGYSFNENTFTGADRVYFLKKGQVLTLGDKDRIAPGSIGISGQDRIFTAGAPAFMIHGAWPYAFCGDPSCPPDNPNQWIAGVISAELWPQFPRVSQQTSYVTPMGWESGMPDTAYTYLIVQAFYDSTIVKINDPTTVQNPDAKATLNRGDVYVYGHYDPNTGPIARPAPGTQVSATGPVQAGLFTSSGQRIDTRYYALTPRDILGSRYVIPVASSVEQGGRTELSRLYIYSFTDQKVHIKDKFGTQTVSLTGGVAYYSYTLPINSGAVVWNDFPNDPNFDFWILGAFDSAEARDDWGYQPVDVGILNDEYFMPFSPSAYPVQGAACPETEPMWVSPAEDTTTINFDFDGDGAPDRTEFLNALEVAKVTDTRDQDNTGTRVWSDKKFALAYGIDGACSGPAQGNLDFGYSVLPFLGNWSSDFLKVAKSGSVSLLPQKSGVVRYTVTVDAPRVDVFTVNLTDTLPVGWQYLPLTTTITFSFGGTNKSGAAAEPFVVGQQLIWMNLGDLLKGARLTLVFDVQVTAGANFGANVNLAEAEGADLAGNIFTSQGQFTTTIQSPPLRTKELYLRRLGQPVQAVDGSSTTEILNRTRPTGPTDRSHALFSPLDTFLYPALASDLGIYGTVNLSAKIRGSSTTSAVQFDLFDVSPSGARTQVARATLTVAASVTQTYKFGVTNAFYTVPAGHALLLQVSAQQGAAPTLLYDSAASPAFVELRTFTYIDIVEAATYKGAAPSQYFYRGDTVSTRVNITDPFGSYDIIGARITITNSLGGTVVADAPMLYESMDPAAPSLWKRFSHPYNIRTSDPLGWWTARVTAVEGNGVTDVVDIPFYVSFYGVSVEPDRVATAPAGSDAVFDETVRNEGVVFDTFDLSASASTMRWPTKAYLGARLIARDDDGDGAFDYVDLTADSNANGLPDVALGVGGSVVVGVVKSVPPGANQLDVDETRLRARSIADAIVTDDALLTTRVPGPAERTKELYFHWISSASDGSMDRLAPTPLLDRTERIQEGGTHAWKLIPQLVSPFSVRLAKLAANLDVSGSSTHAVRVRLLDGAAPVATKDTVVAGARGWYDLEANPTSTYIFPAGAQIRVEVSFPDDGDGDPEYLDLYYDSVTHPTRLEATTTTYVDVSWLNTYDSSGAQVSRFSAGDTVTIRALVTDPFGDYDISSARVTVTDPVGAALLTDQPMGVYSSSPRIYERSLTLAGDAKVGTYSMFVTAVEGNGVTDTGGGTFEVPSGPVNIFKTGDRVVVEPGGLLAYFVDYSIAGTQNAQTVWINDTLPTGVMFLSSTPPPTSVSGNVLRWLFNAVAPGSYQITVLVRVGLLPDGTTITNVAAITVKDPTGNIQGPYSDAFTATVRSTTILAAKVVDKPAAYLQETLTYTVYYNNTGGAPAPMVWINDTLPPGVVFLGSTLPFKAQSGQTFYWEVANVAPGAHSFLVGARLAAGSPGAVKRNVVTIDHSTPAGIVKRSADDANTTVLGATIKLVKVSSSYRTSPGQTLVFTIFYNNSGNRPAEVWLNDTLPSGLLFVSSSPMPTVQSPPLYTWHFPNVSPGPHSVNVTVVVATGASGPQVNRATLHAFDKRATWYPWQFSNVTIDIVPPGILPAKSGPASATPYDVVTYALHYNSTSNETVRRLLLVDTLPLNVTFVSASVPPQSVSGGNVTWVLNNVPPGGHSIDLAVQLPLVADATVLRNKLSANYTLAGLPFDLTAFHDLTIRAPATVAGKTPDRNAASHNQIVTFTLYFNNTGNDTASQVIVEDTIPSGMAFVDSTPPPTSVSGNAVRWVLSGVAPGPHAISLRAVVSTTAPFNTHLINLVEVQVWDSTSDYLYNSTATARVRVQMPVIDPAKTGTIGGVFLDLVTYTLHFNNTGIREALVVWLNDTLPPEEEFVSATPPPAFVSGQAVGWRFANVSVGAHSVQLTVRVKADTVNNTVLVNRVRVEYLDPLGVPQLPSEAVHLLLYPHGVPPYFFPVGTLLIPMDDQQPGLGADPAASFYPGQISAYGMVHWLLTDSVPVFQAMSQTKSYGAQDFTVQTDADGDPNGQNAVAPRDYGGGAFLVKDPVLSTSENEAWARIAAVRATQLLYGDVVVHDLAENLTLLPDDLMLLSRASMIAARSDGHHHGWTDLNSDQIDYVWDRTRYPTAGVPVDQLLEAELRLGALAGGDCERPAHDILVVGDDEFNDPAYFPDGDVLFDELRSFVDRSGLIMLGCTGASAATRLPYLLGPDANATLAEENDIARSDRFSFDPGSAGHPLAQTWGAPAMSRGTFAGWDDGNVFADDVLRLASVSESAPGDLTDEYWGWPAGGATDRRGEVPDIISGSTERDPVLLLDPAGRGAALALGGHTQGRDLPYGPMTSTVGPRITLQSLLLASSWPRLLHEVDPPTAVAGDVVVVKVNLTFESGFALRGVNITERLEPGVLLVPGTLKAGWRGSATHDPLANEIAVSYSYLDPRRTPIFATFDLEFIAGGSEQLLMTTYADFSDVWSPHSVDGARCVKIFPTLASDGKDGRLPVSEPTEFVVHMIAPDRSHEDAAGQAIAAETVRESRRVQVRRW